MVFRQFADRSQELADIWKNSADIRKKLIKFTSFDEGETDADD